MRNAISSMKVPKRKKKPAPGLKWGEPPSEHPKAIEYFNSYLQSEHELDLLKQMPEMIRQRTQIREIRDYAHGILSVIAAGYDPFRVHPNWYCGHIQKPISDRGKISSWNMYKHALPLFVVEKYRAAKASGLFKYISIHSESAEAFQLARLTNTDPIMIGWSPGSSIDAYGKVQGGESFFIAQWDLQSDLAAAGLLLPEKASPEKVGPTVNPELFMRS